MPRRKFTQTLVLPDGKQVERTEKNLAIAEKQLTEKREAEAKAAAEREAAEKAAAEREAASKGKGKTKSNTPENKEG